MAKMIFFAALREMIGRDSIDVEIKNGSTIADILTELAGRIDLDRRVLISDRLRYALNEEFVSIDTPVADSDVIAIIPPISGGWE